VIYSLTALGIDSGCTFLGSHGSPDLFGLCGCGICVSLGSCQCRLTMIVSCGEIEFGASEAIGSIDRDAASAGASCCALVI
jgi:hypothetical protein